MKHLFSALAAFSSVLVLGAYCVIQVGQEARAADAQRRAEFAVSFDGCAVKPWEDGDGNLYVFLPSCFDWNRTELQVLDGTLLLDGTQVEAEGTFLSGYEEGIPYSYSLSFRGEEQSGEVTFVQSANIGSVFIETDSGSMEQVDADKEYRESGRILVMDAEGEIGHIGVLDFIKGRGNATWRSDKKSYAVKLSDAADLFGMGEAKDWILLCNGFDGSKIQNKLCLDMAAAAGLAYSVQSEWIDLYLNGVYHGNYLLCEKVEAGENRVEIGEGFLIERDYYFDKENGFYTEDGNPFSLSYPQTLTQEELEEIAGHLKKIEDEVLAGDLETAGEYLDWDSFILRYVLDETVLNQDTGVTSMFFYKPEGERKLYSGPVWDYDGCLGSGSNVAWMNHKVIAATDIGNYKREGSLTWYPVLYQNEWFLERVRGNYREIIRPYLLEMLEEGIDRYVERIRDSVQMDMLRWDYAAFGAGHYESYENNIRYLKFFLAKRLGFLDEEWLGEENDYTGEGNGQIHTVIFQGDTETETVEVPDGERMLAVPEGLLEEGQWWYNARDGLAYTPDLPVLEDTVFQAHHGSPRE